MPCTAHLIGLGTTPKGWGTALELLGFSFGKEGWPQRCSKRACCIVRSSALLPLLLFHLPEVMAIPVVVAVVQCVGHLGNHLLLFPARAPWPLDFKINFKT